LLEFLRLEHLLVVDFFNLLLLNQSGEFSLLRFQLDNGGLVVASIFLGLTDHQGLELEFSVALLSLL